MSLFMRLLRFALPGWGAQRRAGQLLRENLTPCQRQQVDQYAYFEVIGGATGSRYRIHDRAMVNIDQLDASYRILRKWCFAPEGNLANGDVLLAQKLALELFEKEALSSAIPHPAHYQRAVASSHPIGPTRGWGSARRQPD